MTNGPDLGFTTLRWADGNLLLLDQTKLPHVEKEMVIESIGPLVDAIQRLCVRGAPALGCAGAYGMVLGVVDSTTAEEWLETLHKSAAILSAARPTAVNLVVGVNHIRQLGEELFAATTVADFDVDLATAKLLDEAVAFHETDAASCLAIAENTLPLLADGSRILTHCNAGALATGGLGTALAPIHLGHSRGLKFQVFADETRPLRQGARLTAWELARHGVPVSVLPDSAAASLLASGGVDFVIVGSDRIAANGDVANKIGTFPLAVMAARFGVPLLVLAPGTTIDPHCPSGADIPIEQRSAEEILGEDGAREGVAVYNPAFDVTPADLVQHIITDHGVFQAHGEGRDAWKEYVAGLGQN
jgi:methylthioribose-1-phosphate isomerase